MKKGSLYYEKASALLASDPSVARDDALQAQVLLTQGLLLFCTEQVRSRAHTLFFVVFHMVHVLVDRVSLRFSNIDFAFKLNCGDVSLFFLQILFICAV